MKSGVRFKLMLILCLIGLGVYLILPTIGEKSMEVTFKSDITEQTIETLKKDFPGESYQIVKNADNKSLIVKGYKLSSAKLNQAKQIPGVKKAKLLKHWAEFIDKKVNLGLDLQGGMQVVLQANYAKMEKKRGKTFSEDEKKEITAQALEKINHRIDEFGVAEPSVRPKGVEAIEIQLPGVADPEGVKKAIKMTGRVEYRLVDDAYSNKAISYFQSLKKVIPEDKADLEEFTQEISKAINLPSHLEVLYRYERVKDSNKLIPVSPTVLEKTVALNGDDIESAYQTRDEYQQLAVGFNTTTDGAVKFSNITSKKNHGRRMAIIIDDKVRSDPRINNQITNGKAQITGNFSYEEVQVLVRIIKEGALPVDLEIIEERTVGPSLGQDSIESGVKAILIGLALIMIFMIAYYKVAGLIANVCLLLNMMFMLALLSMLGFTLTLPGIAGFILTVGMSVDANVIIYERIKEEQKKGKSARTAVINGFERAFSTILDANLTTVIAAFILYQFGTGPIKGFAVTLIIGIICSMFVVLYISKFIYELMTSFKSVKKLSI